jgi:hypothetical protein
MKLDGHLRGAYPSGGRSARVIGPSHGGATARCALPTDPSAPHGHILPIGNISSQGPAWACISDAGRTLLYHSPVYSDGAEPGS